MRALRRKLLCGLSVLGVLALPSFASAQTSDLINCNGRLVRSLDFNNQTLINGTDLQQGAIYSYLGVGDGVDAEVEILGFVNGVVNGDNLNTVDRILD